MSNQLFIDLRSDTVTKPSPAMREAMVNAEVGDDVFGEDPTVNRLQEKVAQLLGKEAALFVPSGVMANQLAIKVHTQPGEEIIVEAGSHIFNYETGAPSMISHVQMQTLQGNRGILRNEDIVSAIRSSAYYLPRTALICLENTHNRAGGTIYPLEKIKSIAKLATERGLPLHLDGARLWHACVATGISAIEYAKYFDSVSVCFSKGLGAPIGSALVGNKALIERAHKVRKILGGGMRQVGILAAAALYGLQNNMDRLKEDHHKAKLFAKELVSIAGFEIDGENVETNIVIIDVTKTGRLPAELLRILREKGVLLSEMSLSTIRAVMHMDVSLKQVQEAAAIVKNCFSP